MAQNETCRVFLQLVGVFSTSLQERYNLQKNLVHVVPPVRRMPSCILVSAPSGEPCRANEIVRTASSVCKTKAVDIGDDGSARGDLTRDAGSGRAGGAGLASKSCTPRRMLPTAEMPPGVHDAVAGSSISCMSLAPTGTCGP